MMKEVKKDKLVSNNMSIDDYSKLYPQSDENIYLDLDFKGKDVLNVFSSGNQKSIQKLLGANSLDGLVDFDINILTKYYYYMRMWAIMCKNDIYPYGLIEGDLSYLGDILNTIKIKSREEKEAFDFWSLVYKNGLDVSKLFYDDNNKEEFFLKINK